MGDAVRLSFEDDIALLALSQPESRNAFSEEIKAGLQAAMEQLSAKADLRALIFTGADGVFCAGGDLKRMLERHKNGEKNTQADVKQRMNEVHYWLKQLRDLPVPVIVAVDGPAFGAGFALALTGDIILATDRAQFNASFGVVGAVPDCNLMWSLPRVVGLQRARELFFTARTVDAKEALQLGICMEITVPDALLPRAWDIARMMSNLSPSAYAMTKEITARAMESDSDAILELEAQAQAKCLMSDYHIDAIARFAQKLPLKFRFQ